MAADELSATEMALPVRTPRLLLRPRVPGDGESACAAILESWEELHRWMWWAESLDQFTPEQLNRRYSGIVSAPRSGNIELIGVEVATGVPVVWCGLHHMDWHRRWCETGYWVRRSAQGRGMATEAANAMVRYAFGALGMRGVGLTYSDGNEASRRVAEKLGFAYQGVERAANRLPGGRMADRICYERFSADGLPALDVHWGKE